MKLHRFSCIILAAVLCLCILIPAVKADLCIELNETDWTWDPSNIAAFEGVVSLDQNSSENMKLQLSFSTYPEATDPGEIVFQTVNGKKLTLRKQKPEYTISSEGLTEIRFVGNWKTPDDVYFTRITVLLQVFDESNGTLLAEKSLVVNRDVSEMAENNDGRFRLTADFSSWTLWITAAAVAVWISAIIRIALNRKKGKW